jgi:2-dehydropantoate 2-reductase
LSDWHILGAGAIGCLFAANLQRSGVSCSLILRTASAAQCDIEVEDAARHSSVRVATTSAQATPMIQRLLVTTKAYDVERALSAVKHRLDSGSQVLIMVNGMGLLEIAAAQLAGVSLFAGTTTEGVYRNGAQKICHAGRGVTRIGSLDARTQPDWFDDWLRLPLACHWDTDIEAALWHKLAINCAINPLSALHRVPNGELGRDSALKASVAALCREIAAVSEAAGFGESARLIATDTRDVIQRTARNKSSMLQDTLAGRRTEIEFITGYLVRRADALGVPVDRNRELLERMRNLEP